MKRAKDIAIFSIFLVVLYIAIYGAFYCNRKPSADPAFWRYTGHGPRWVEDCFFHGFYPVYIIHQRVFHCQRHMWDFPNVEIAQVLRFGPMTLTQNAIGVQIVKDAKKK